MARRMAIGDGQEEGPVDGQGDPGGLSQAPGSPGKSQRMSQDTQEPNEEPEGCQANEARGKHSKTRGRQLGTPGELRTLRRGVPLRSLIGPWSSCHLEGPPRSPEGPPEGPLSGDAGL